MTLNKKPPEKPGRFNPTIHPDNLLLIETTGSRLDQRPLQ